MKRKSTISKLGAIAAVAIASVSTSFAQTDLGKNCGCPPVASRPTVLLSASANPGGPGAGELIANTVLTCDKIYILDTKIYVPDGKTLTINPGTLIKGRAAADPAQATALIVERGGRILADGEEDCQIVFTAEDDPMDGTYPIANRGKWGGVVILGKATNNLKVCNNNSATGFDGVGFIEGFNSADARNLYGMPVGQADDNDNSGVFEYVSIRHSGAILTPGNELNGLSLGSVGRGTTIEHIEIISSDDDGIELFGGTVNLKYCVAMFGADDMFDWDLGWSGKAQFLFGIKTDGGTTPTADNGFEADADDQKSGAFPRSHPIIYNATLIGNGNPTPTSDNTGPAGIMAKELTEGEIYNSIFANYRYGFNLVKALGGTTACGSHSIEAYNNWINGSLLVKCNAFVGNTDAFTIDKTAAAGTDLSKFTGDGNTAAATLSGFDFVLTQNTSTNSVSHPYDAIPNPNLSTNCAVTADGFFTPVAFKGAFDASKKSWMSNWAYATLLKVTSGLVPCPTDVNTDGVTNNIDFLQLLGQFNQSCK